jgi:beta-phosphoglucomutase-like phosphatase (HAD superfamily)
VPGIVEATGAIELQDDGFRAERARPFALVVTPGRNAARARRLARRYHAEIAEVDDAQGLLAWCEERGLGLGPATVEHLLGPEHAARSARQRRRARRRTLARVACVAAVAAAVLGFGAAFATGPPSAHGVYGRTGWVTCPQPSAADVQAGRPAPVPPDC